MRLTGLVFATLLAVTLALAPGLAFARAGGGSSMGSRGARTYSAPPVTRTAPGTAAPMQRSVAPQSAPGAASGGFAPSRPGFFGSGFGAGLMGGLIGAGIGGMLFGGGMFGGVHGFGGFFGLLIQIFLVVMVVRWLIRRFMPSRQPALAGPAAMYGREAQEMPMGGGGGGGMGDAPITVTPADYQQFEQVLQHVQAGWSAQDINALRGSVTPEMLSYFADQLSDQASHGVRNTVTEVKLEQGDLAEAWAEPGREYASVAMRFSMIDVTRDAAGRVVEGDVAQRTQATEVWTFLRAPGGHWILSAIQQAG
jgi:predicted lipid-binding transport protein (Tim44 family)